MKKLNLLFTALLLLYCIGTANAEEVTIDGIKYDVVTKAKQAKVISGGNYSGDIVIPSEITYNDVVCSVTSIGDDAFYYCTGLTNVVIGNSVTSIGESAFEYCSRLTSVEIPNSVTSIGGRAFFFCTGLEEVCISDLTAWYNIDFADTSANPLCFAKNLYLNGELVTELVIPDGVKEIKNYTFYCCTCLTSIIIPNSVTSIGYEAFGGCKALTSITIPNSVTSIGSYAFSGCTGLTSITIPNSVTSIGNYAFKGCSGLTSITIPNSVTSIGRETFRECTGLTSITIPNSVTSIGNQAFYWCTGLTSVTIPNSVTSIGDYAFYSCDVLTSVVIGDGVTSIGSYAFYDCKGLTNVVIGNSVTSIGRETFCGCKALTSITIPNSVTFIGNQAFYWCTGLTSVTIGTGVKNIVSEAFAKCENLANVYCLATSVPSTYSDAFNESYPEYMTLHVPEEAINSYKTTAPWSSFGTVVTLDGEDIIEPEVKICAMPTVSYSDGKLHFECETEGAEFVTEITSSDFNKFYNNDINLTATYNISVYATATGYENSDIVNATLCWIECDCNAEDSGITNIPAKAVLVTSNNGSISISCSLDGESVAVYTTAGTLIATTTIENGTATVATGLSKGSVAIVNIAGKSIKVAVN